MKNFWKSLKDPPLIFFHSLQPTGVSQSPKGPPFTILSLTYSADFGCSQHVQRKSDVLQYSLLLHTWSLISLQKSLRQRKQTEEDSFS